MIFALFDSRRHFRLCRARLSLGLELHHFHMASITTFARHLNKPLASIPTVRAAARPFSTSNKHLFQQSAGKDTAPPTPRASRPPPPPRKSIRIWPQLVGIFVGGTLLFDYMVKQRAGNGPKGEKTLSSRPFCMSS